MHLMYSLPDPGDWLCPMLEKRNMRSREEAVKSPGPRALESAKTGLRGNGEAAAGIATSQLHWARHQARCCEVSHWTRTRTLGRDYRSYRCCYTHLMDEGNRLGEDRSHAAGKLALEPKL